MAMKPRKMMKKGGAVKKMRGGGMGKKMRGEVIAANHEENFVIIDLGKISGIEPGMQLKVVRGSKDIGLIEVIEVRKEISAADIKKSLDVTKIQEGDVVVNK